MESVPGSFRDPSGYVYHQQGKIFRTVNRCYTDDYEFLNSSGLYEELVKENLLISHNERPVQQWAEQTGRNQEEIYRLIQPTVVPVISYPYEWCFSQLKDAALATLTIQKIALEHNMTLKDASAFNIQFLNLKPIFIDTLSFERYEEGNPWAAYRQFCQHFLAPLALMAHVDVRMGELSKQHIDGPPLDLVVRLLPWKCRLSVGLNLHLYMHAKAQAKYQDTATISKSKLDISISKRNLLNMIRSLYDTVDRLEWTLGASEWGDYYDNTNYSDSSFTEKRRLVNLYLDAIPSRSKVLDIGANTGEFSRIASQKSDIVLSCDIDKVAVEKNYRNARKENDTKLIPLYLDLTNPSPNLGWDSSERSSFFARIKPDVTMALALVHHLAISNNVPLAILANFFARVSPYLIIEFVDKTDSQVKRLLSSRKDIFGDYTRCAFEANFLKYFKLIQRDEIKGTARTLYLFKIISNP